MSSWLHTREYPCYICRGAVGPRRLAENTVTKVLISTRSLFWDLSDVPLNLQPEVLNVRRAERTGQCVYVRF